MPAFEMDLCPDTHWPRIRFNFANGWSASVVCRVSDHPCHAQLASVAACPTGRWGEGATELGETEASPDEVARYLAGIQTRSRIA